MAKIITKKGCGNSPKAKFIQDFLVALANMEVEQAVEMLDDDVYLDIMGQGSYSGKEEIKDIIIKDDERPKMTKLEVSKILSHGKHCAANGVMYFENGGKVGFNNMYTFSSHGKKAKLNLIEVYSLELHSDN